MKCSKYVPKCIISDSSFKHIIALELLQTPGPCLVKASGKIAAKNVHNFHESVTVLGGEGGRVILEKSKSKSGVHCVSRLSVPRPLTLVSEVLPYGRELVVGPRFIGKSSHSDVKWQCFFWR